MTELLLQRNSFAKLQEPAPKGQSRERIFQSALRAPDHAMLKPWRFLVIEGEQRSRFGELMAETLAKIKPEASDAELEKARNNPFRAPVIVIAICATVDHPKVPKVEQLLSTGCAVHQMLLAAELEGYGGIWRTGPLAYDAQMKSALLLKPDEEIVGFLYLGTPSGKRKEIQKSNTEDYFSDWK